MKAYQVLYSNPSLGQVKQVIFSADTRGEAQDYIDQIPYHKGKSYEVVEKENAIPRHILLGGQEWFDDWKR